MLFQAFHRRFSAENQMARDCCDPALNRASCGSCRRDRSAEDLRLLARRDFAEVADANHDAIVFLPHVDLDPVGIINECLMALSSRSRSPATFPASTRARRSPAQPDSPLVAAFAKPPHSLRSGVQIDLLICSTASRFDLAELRYPHEPLRWS